MNTELEKIKLELQKYLYPDENKKNNIDKTNLKKTIFLLLRECLKKQVYVIEIGSYIINITPQKLYVKYEADHTTIEVSNNDVFYETVRDIETRFFAISKVKKDEFLIDIPIIRTTGIVTNIDGICEEHYCFELYTDEEDDIRNYLIFPDGVEIIGSENPNNYELCIKRKISINDPRSDVYDILDKEKVVPVYLDTIVEKYKTIYEKKEYTPNNYTLLIPKLEEKKAIITFIYSSMVDFYQEYMNNK